jgi:hypothetical protein
MKPTLIPDRRAAQRYGVHIRTLARWDKTPELAFPPPVYLRGRRYREAAALDQWDLENSRKAAALHAPTSRREREADSSTAA